MTPFEISILLHCHVCPLDDESIPNSQLKEDTLQRFVEEGLLRVGSEGDAFEGMLPRFVATERCHAFVRLLQEVPLPVLRWLDPRMAPGTEASR